LGGDLAGPVGDIRLPVAQHIHALGNAGIVPAMITPAQVGRVRSLTAEAGHWPGISPR
jgi:hypothetical protein